VKGLPEIPGQNDLMTKTKDFFHSAVRAPCGQPEPFHQSNKFLRGGKLSMVCSGSWNGGEC
jgi:hypothetical protein